MPAPMMTTSLMSASFGRFERERHDFPVLVLAHVRAKPERQADLQLSDVAVDRRQDAHALGQLDQAEAERSERIRPLVVARRAMPHDRVGPQYAALSERNISH